MIGGVIFILASIWLYTESLCITIIVIYSIIASLSIAYYIYHEIFLLSFFPFMNILAVVVSIGTQIHGESLVIVLFKKKKTEEIFLISSIFTYRNLNIYTVDSR